MAERVLGDRALNRALLARQGLLKLQAVTPLQMAEALEAFVDFWAPEAERRELQLAG